MNATTNDSALVERVLVSGQEREMLRAEFGGHSVSTDGRWVALITSRRAITVVPTATGSPREIFHVEAPHYLAWNTPAWTPDGRSVIAKTNSEDGGALWLVATNGSPARRLEVDVREMAGPAFTGLALHRDGRRLAFVSGVTRREIWVLENFLEALTTSTEVRQDGR